MSQNVLELSSTYQALEARGIAKGIVEGRAEEARRTILRLGTKRLGEPNDEVVTAVDAIAGLEMLEAIVDRLLGVESWQDLLA